MSAYPFSCRSYGRERIDILDIASKLTLIHPYIMQRRFPLQKRQLPSSMDVPNAQSAQEFLDAETG